MPYLLISKRSTQRILIGFFASSITLCVPGFHVLAAESKVQIQDRKIEQLEKLHKIASDHLIQNEFNEALKVYQEILFIEPDDDSAYANMGRIYLLKGQYKLAHEAFTNSLHINPENDAAIFGIKTIVDPDGVEGLVHEQEIQDNFDLMDPSTQSPPPSAPEKPINILERPETLARNVLYKTESLTVPPSIVYAKRFQMALKKAGFYKGDIDGKVGIDLKKSLKEYQKKVGLPQSGRMTKATWTQLSKSGMTGVETKK